MSRAQTVLVVVVAAALLAAMVRAAPPVAVAKGGIITATDAGKMKEIKAAVLGGKSSQALEGEDAEPAEAPAASDATDEEAPAEEAPAEGAPAEAEAAAEPAEGKGEDADDDDEPDGIADNADEAAKTGFFKNIIGGGMGGMGGMEGGNHHPSKDIPALVYALPIVGFIGVGVAIAAYCSFGT